MAFCVMTRLCAAKLPATSLASRCPCPAHPRPAPTYLDPDVGDEEGGGLRYGGAQHSHNGGGVLEEPAGVGQRWE
jgi:hypothetical protein